MTNEEIKKLISMVKTMPEGHKLLKELILDYLSLKDRNVTLINTNLTLLEDIKQYENIIREQKEFEIIIN